jgi:hypothetical protein
LRCKGLQQLNRTIRKFARLPAPDHDGAINSVSTKQRNKQKGAEPGADDDIKRP